MKGRSESDKSASDIYYDQKRLRVAAEIIISGAKRQRIYRCASGHNDQNPPVNPGMFTVGETFLNQRAFRDLAKPPSLSRNLLFKDTSALFLLLEQARDGGPVVPLDAPIVVVSSTEPPSSILESMPMAVLVRVSQVTTRVSQHLSDADLWSLSQANSYCEHLFSRDEFWKWRAEEKQISKAIEEQNWKWNYMAAEEQQVYGRPLSECPVFFQGEVTIIDPFKIFFTGSHSALRLQQLKAIALSNRQQNRDFVVLYRGLHAAFVTSRYWDSDTAFEITRNGMSLGVDEAISKFIAAIPKKLVDLLVEENGTKFEGGVTLEGVDGQFLSSGDGDFIISRRIPHSKPSKLSKWIEDDAVRNADVVCAAGGSWTFCEDSSTDDEDEDLDLSKEFTNEELKRVIGEDGEVDLDALQMMSG